MKRHLFAWILVLATLPAWAGETIALKTADPSAPPVFLRRFSFVRIPEAVHADDNVGVLYSPGDCATCVNVGFSKKGSMHNGLYYYSVALNYEKLEFPGASNVGEGVVGIDVKVGDLVRSESGKRRVGAIFKNGDILVGSRDLDMPRRDWFVLIKAGDYKKYVSVKNQVAKSCGRLMHLSSAVNAK